MSRLVLSVPRSRLVLLKVSRIRLETTCLVPITISQPSKPDKAMGGRVQIVQIMYDNRSLMPRSMLAVPRCGVCLDGCDVLTRGSKPNVHE
jgi:hypothetical protein